MAGVLDDPERWRRISAILDRLLETPAAERPALLDRLCAGDPELRAEVEALLAADAATGGILDLELDLDGGGEDAAGDRSAAELAAAGLAAAGVAAVTAAVWWGAGLEVDGPRAPAAATAAAGGESAVEAAPVVGVVPLVNRTGDPELDPYGAVLARLVGDLLSAASTRRRPPSRAVELLPGSANNHHSLGNAYRAQGELDLAAAEYLESLRLDPAFHFSTLSLAEVRVFQGRWREAEELLAGLLEGADVAPRHRIDAAFHLAAVHRARGRFAAAAELLEAMAEPIAAERIRDAMAHAVRATCQLELGRPGAAARLAEEAVDRSPGVPTRYLFARGLVEFRQGRLDAVAATAERILEGALPPENPDRTEEKAAHLRGLRHLARGEADPAIEELTLAVALEGYEYGVYRLGLARAYLADGRLDEAMAAARQAAGDRHLAAPRLDLELDRTRALLLLARIQAAMGRPTRAAELARDFLTRWADADPGHPDLGHPDLAAARALAAAEPATTGAGRSTPPDPG